MNQPKHLAVIDQLRGIAILMVLVQHSFGYAGSVPSIPPNQSALYDYAKLFDFLFHCTFANGFLGVMIFFVLSGFCIRWSHLKGSHFTWKSFYSRRFFRIIPAYWVWLLIGSIVSNAKLYDFILHALLLQNLRADTYHSIITPLWSIAIEWQIYLLYPVILFISSKFEKGLVLTFFAFANLGSSLLASSPAAEFMGSDALRIFGRLPTALMFSWMLGFYMANSLHDGNLVSHSPLPFVLSLLAGILTYLHPNTVFLSSVPWSLAAYFLVNLLVTRKAEKPLSKFNLLAGVGIISYSVYLSHDLFASLYPHIERFFHISKGSFSDGTHTVFLLIMPMLLVGFLSYRFFELQGIRVGKSLIRRMKDGLNES